MNLSKEIQSSIPFRYAEDVRAGNITVGKNIRQAVDRFFSWIETADEDGYHLDHGSGMHVIEFFESFLCHTKGRWAGNAIELAPYQQFTFYNIFAWKDQKGNRRINKVYEKVARKNGKTAALAGLALYFLTFDDEESPEIYVGATKEKQAKILWGQAKDYVIKSFPLRKIGVDYTQRQIRFPRSLGKFEFMGRDSDTEDGLSPSLGIMDEYHAHKDDGVLNVIESAMGARVNPLVYIITTAGFNTASVCKQAEDVFKDILSGVKEDDHTLIMIHDLDEGDDWEDPANWVKANPNLDVSVSLDYLLREYKNAKNQPAKIPNFKTKHLNQWVDAAEVRIPDDIWMKSSGKIRLNNFMEYGCAGAIDLSSTTDLSAIVYVSNPDEDGIRDVLPFFFCPADTVKKRSKEDRVPYSFWKDSPLQAYITFKGQAALKKENFWKNLTLITATPGNQIDYDTIKDYIAYGNELLKPKLHNYDPWAATQLVQDLEKRGVKMNPFPQTITHFSFPTKEFESLAYQGKFRHGGHPVLKWMMSGCVAYEDPNENIRYVKNRSTKRIDGIIAEIMALAGTIMEGKESNESKYNNPNEEVFV